MWQEEGLNTGFCGSLNEAYQAVASTRVPGTVPQAPQRSRTPVVVSTSAHACGTPEKEASQKAHAISISGFEFLRLSRLPHCR